MSELLIFGATRNSGLYIARDAVQRGFSVSAMVRPESDSEALTALGVKIVAGDAFSYQDCVNAIDHGNPEWIISTLGGKDRAGKRIDALGNIHVIQAASRIQDKLKRFILITSMGSGDQYEGTSPQVKQFLGEALRAKTEAEDALQQSGLPWTIIRPGGLNHEPPNHQYRITDGRKPLNAQYISRQDLAIATLDLLENPDYKLRIINVHG